MQSIWPTGICLRMVCFQYVALYRRLAELHILTAIDFYLRISKNPYSFYPFLFLFIHSINYLQDFKLFRLFGIFFEFYDTYFSFLFFLGGGNLMKKLKFFKITRNLLLLITTLNRAVISTNTR